jgi:3-oxoacyl-[acyl-carrier-protein] synthase-3
VSVRSEVSIVFPGDIHPASIGLRGVAGVLPPRRLSVDDLAAQGRLISDPRRLADLDFSHVHVADEEHDLRWLAREAAVRALADADLPPSKIDLVIWASALAEDHVAPRPNESADSFDAQRAPLSAFRYPSGWLQDELQLDCAQVLAVAQQGCASLFAALNIARNTLVAEPDKSHVLCVGVDVLPAAAPREILYNVISDAACGVVVSRDCPRDHWLSYSQLSKGYYWDTPRMQKEILAAYFPTARLAIAELLSRAALRPDEVDVVLPSGIQPGSWQVLLDLAGIPQDRLYRTRSSFGHSIVADNFILLDEARRTGRLTAGQRLLLFTYGFGSSWCCLLLEH